VVCAACWLSTTRVGFTSAAKAPAPQAVTPSLYDLRVRRNRDRITPENAARWLMRRCARNDILCRPNCIKRWPACQTLRQVYPLSTNLTVRSAVTTSATRPKVFVPRSYYLRAVDGQALRERVAASPRSAARPWPQDFGLKLTAALESHCRRLLEVRCYCKLQR